MKQVIRNLESFYKVIEQALIRHDYVDQERDKISFYFNKKFEYGKFTFSFQVHPHTASIEVEPVRLYLDAVEEIMQGLDYPDKTKNGGTICDELPDELASLHERMKQDPTEELALALGVATLHYIEEGIKQFEQDHSIPDNIVEKLEYEDFWAVPFSGSPLEGMLRGLVFYKLIDEYLYYDKCVEADQIIENREFISYDRWRVCYYELKRILRTVKPIY